MGARGPAPPPPSPRHRPPGRGGSASRTTCQGKVSRGGRRVASCGRGEAGPVRPSVPDMDALIRPEEVTERYDGDAAPGRLAPSHAFEYCAPPFTTVRQRP